MVGIQPTKCKHSEIIQSVQPEDVFLDRFLPKPRRFEAPADISGYTKSRLRDGLRLAHFYLQNAEHVPPVSQHCLTFYKKTLETILKKNYADEREKQKLLSSVLQFERDILNGDIMRFEIRNIPPELISQLAKLRRLELASRYGVYLPAKGSRSGGRRVSHDCSEQQSPEWKRFWTNINAEILREKDAWLQWQVCSPSARDEDVQTTHAVYRACLAIGFNFGETMRTIQRYAKHNNFESSPVRVPEEESEWKRLLKIVSQDLVDVALAMPTDQARYISILQDAVESTINTYWERPDNCRRKYEYNPTFWTPRSEFYFGVQNNTRRDEMRGPIIRDPFRDTSSGSSTPASHKPCKSTFARIKSAMEGKKPAKFAPEEQRADREAVLERRMTAWMKLTTLQASRDHGFRTYKDKEGNILPPIDFKTWAEI